MVISKSKKKFTDKIRVSLNLTSYIIYYTLQTNYKTKWLSVNLVIIHIFHIDTSIDFMCRKIQGLSKEEKLKDAIFSDLQ